MRRVTLAKTGLTAAIALIVLALVVGMIPAPAAHAVPVRAASGVHLASQPHPPATGPITITSSFKSNFSTQGLPYFTLPYNVTWNVNIVNTTLDSHFTQSITISFVNSILCPLFFPCLTVYSDAVNPTWVTSKTSTSGTYYYPLTLLNLTAQHFLGFDLPQGAWIFAVDSHYDDGLGNVSDTVLSQSAFMAPTGPAGSITQPVANSNLTAGRTVIAGEYSGYFVATANVTVYNATGFTVLTAPVYAPGYGEHAFAVSWAAVTPGTYSVVLTLTAVWHQVFKVSVPVNIVAAVPLTYLNTTSLIPGLGNGGSAALLVTIGAIIGMVVMALVGRGMFGGTKPSPAAQPWSSTPSTPSGTTTGTMDSGGGTMGGGTMGGGSGSGDMSKPPT